ncbi:MAG TPA: DUF5667 domain-containing protein [Nocardioides sp.]|nr:DUF5667 domain-containing protein [Nocardioides sp.]
MSSVFASRRRAEEFSSLVEGSPSSGSDARYDDFLAIVAQLRDVAGPEPRPEFVSSLRERLMAAADTALVPTPADRLTLPPRRTHRERRLAAAVGGVAIVGATTSMAMAAQSALPGDLLYPVKRAIENVHTGLSLGADAKGSTLLASARGRLDEVSALSQAGGSDEGGAISDTLNAFTEQATEATDLLLQDYATTGDETSIVQLRDFTADSMNTLAALEGRVPADARDAIVHAARVLTQIDAAAQKACPSCGGAGISQIPPGLASSAGQLADVDPVLPASGATITKSTKHRHGGSKSSGTKDTSSTDDQSTTTSLPQVQTTTSPDGSGTKTDDATTSDPVQDLTDGLTGGGSGGGGSEPTSGPSGVPGLPDVGDVVDDAGGLLGG